MHCLCSVSFIQPFWKIYLLSQSLLMHNNQLQNLVAKNMLVCSLTLWVSISTGCSGDSKVGEGPKHRSFCSQNWGESTSWYVGIFTKLKALQTPYNWCFMEAFSCRHNQLLVLFPVFCFQSLSLLLGSGGGVELKMSSISSWLGLSGDQSPCRRPPRVPSIE